MNPTSQIFEIRNESGKLIAVFRPKLKVVKGGRAPKADKIVTITDVVEKYVLKRQPEHKSGVNAEINLTKQTIRIYGNQNNRWDRELKEYSKIPFDRTFAVGDTIEYGSYNLYYTNPILGVKASYVQVLGHGSMKHLSIAEFIRRNWDLDLEKIAKENLETSQCI